MDAQGTAAVAKRADAERELEIPLEGASEGLLLVRGGLSHVTVLAADIDPLVRARFGGVLPAVESRPGVVEIEARLSALEWLQGVALGGTSADLTLRARLPWALEVRGGISSLTADLRGVRLRSLVVTGGASEVIVDLPPAEGVVPVRIAGGASRVRLRRPPGVGARVEVRGGASSLQLDRQRVGAAGGRLHLVAPGEGCYDVRVGGGASALTIT